MDPGSSSKKIFHIMFDLDPNFLNKLIDVIVGQIALISVPADSVRHDLHGAGPGGRRGRADGREPHGARNPAHQPLNHGWR